LQQRFERFPAITTVLGYVVCYRFYRFVSDGSRAECLFDPLFEDFRELIGAVGGDFECLAVQSALTAWIQSKS
jgi:hypothetical protein